MTPSDPVELVLGTLAVVGLLMGTTVAGWVLIAVLLRIFRGPSYDESARFDERGRDDDGW